MLTFEEYRQNAPEGSERWATSDRGWAFEPDALTSFAHYLRYDHGKGYRRDGKHVHVVIVGRGVVWVRTCADARLAIRAAYKHERRRIARHNRDMRRAVICWNREDGR